MSTQKQRRQEASPDPRADTIYRDAMMALIAERWGEVWKAVPVALAGEDPEGVHDVRVASRRLRAAMDVAVECFPSSWYRPLHRAAKDITSALGEVRDRDVLIIALSGERDQAPAAERPGLNRLIDRVERERVVARVAMESFLNDLLKSAIPREAVARFGAAANPPRPTKQRHGDSQERSQ